MPLAGGDRNGASDGNAPAIGLQTGTSLKALLAARNPGKGAEQKAAATRNPINERARRFADAVIGGWIGQMRDMSRLSGLVRYLGVAAETTEMLSEELVAAAIRTDLPDKLASQCSAAELIAAKRRAQFVEEQVLIAERALADFIMYLGGLDQPRIANSFMPERKVFSGAPSAAGIPNLEEGRENQQRILFMTDWLTMLHQVVIDNAGFQDGAEITLEQNARLGGIVRQLAMKG
jgi:hypothetical protein